MRPAPRMSSFWSGPQPAWAAARTPQASGSAIAPAVCESPSGITWHCAAGTATRWAYAPGRWAPMSLRLRHRLVRPALQLSHVLQTMSGLKATWVPLGSASVPSITVPDASWPMMSGGLRRALWPR